KLATTLPFFNINWWIGQVNGSTKMVEVKVVDKRGLLANARWVNQRAVDTGQLTGRDSAKATSEQKQVVNDLLASLGWNGGKRRLTKSLDPSAWWREDDLPDEHQPLVHDRFATILAHLTTHYQSKEASAKMIAILRQQSASKAIPCQEGGIQDGHRYWLVGGHPIRLRCKQCRHNLYEAEAFQWCAKLVDRGHVPLQCLGLDLLHGTVSPHKAMYLSVQQEIPAQDQEDVQSITGWDALAAEPTVSSKVGHD
ncbi:unnamed protein product, partial [Cutaneotrichosporon oleaginosum]